VTALVGVVLVDKPEGSTSHDVVEAVRKVAGTRKVGHAGTLDPFASGLLLVLLGAATRLSEYLMGLEKEYDATVRLGVETATQDLEGVVVAERSGWDRVGPQELEDALQGLRGRIRQVPPMYSAKKVRGEAAHRRARRGEEVTLDPVEVDVHELEVLALSLPEVRLRVRCSSGTYIRGLARDLGRSLEVGGHLTSLRRTSVGSFSVSSASSLEALAAPGAISSSLVSPADALTHLPPVEVDSDEAARIRQGQFLDLQGNGVSEDTPVRVLFGGELVAVATREGTRLRPRKVLAHG
jgi:tRNA pseudouridine55 synthase